MRSCPEDKVLNPATNRCVKRDGRIGKKIIADTYMRDALQSPIPEPKPIKSSKGKALRRNPRVIKSSDSDVVTNPWEDCNNDYDPIIMEKFSDMSPDDQKRLIKLGNDKKKNCYHLDSIFGVYKEAVLSNKSPKDPMNPSHILTDKEIMQINRLKKLQDPKYTKPIFKPPSPYPQGYTLDISEVGDFYRVRVMFRNRTKHDLGYIPAWVELAHTHSADNTSFVLLANIRELWDQRLLMENIETRCRIQNLGKPIGYWHENWVNKFVTLSSEVRDLLP